MVFVPDENMKHNAKDFHFYLNEFMVIKNKLRKRKLCFLKNILIRFFSYDPDIIRG